MVYDTHPLDAVHIEEKQQNVVCNCQLATYKRQSKRRIDLEMQGDRERLLQVIFFWQIQTF